MANVTEFFRVMLNLIADFLGTEPIIYIFVLVILILIVRIFRGIIAP